MKKPEGSLISYFSNLVKRDGGINLAQGRPGFAPPDELMAILADKAPNPDLHQYAPGNGNFKLIKLFLFGKNINVSVYVGGITLAGIVVNNSVVLVDYIRLLQRKRMNQWRAIIKGGQSRLRPVLMTSGTTVLALLPMALDRGEGSSVWAPLALTIIGGLLSSTLLTLFVLPILCSFVRTEGISASRLQTHRNR